MKLALGTAQFGLDYGVANRAGRVPMEEAREIVRHARLLGLDTIDTAAVYGSSEQRLGEIGVEGWRVVTKLPAVPPGCEDVTGWVAASAKESLERLRLSALYAVLLHRPQQLLEPGGSTLYAALCGLREAGLTAKIGISIYGPDELESLTSAGYEFDVVQAPLNVVDRRLAESGWLTRLHEARVEVHTRSVFLQGLLLMKTNDRPAIFDRWSGLWSEWDAWLAACELSALAACLRFVAAFAAVDRIVVGIDSMQQLKEAAVSVEGALPPLPERLSVRDIDLINPARWPALAAQ